MSDKLQALFDEFVTRARALLIAEVQDQLAGMAASPNVPRHPTGPGPGGRGKRVALAAAPAPKLLPRPKKGKGSRRSAEEQEAQLAQVIAFLKKTPNVGVEKIAAGVGISSGELALPISKGLASKQLAKKGERRATVYRVR